MRPLLGVIGFPLRLLAREVYDRVVAMKGEKQVALLTGEERIVPPQARYFLCTAESMPVGDEGRRGARFRLCRDRRGATRHRPRARARLHRPDASRPRPRGDIDPWIGDAQAAGPRASSRCRDHQPSALFDPALCRQRQAVAPAPTLSGGRLLRRAGLRARRNAAPLQGRRCGGDGRPVARHPQRPGCDVPARRGRLSGRHRRHRHGPQHGRQPTSPSPAWRSSTAAATAA